MNGHTAGLNSLTQKLETPYKDLSFPMAVTSPKNQFNKIEKPSNTCVIKYKGPKMFWDEGNSHGVQETTLKYLSQTFHKCRNYNLAT